MSEKVKLTAEEALEKLKAGNREYISAERGAGDISPAARRKTCDHGQQPYAIIIACSDSRVIPESIFSAGIGDLFVIRVAGNVMDNHQLGSVDYAASHLGCRLVVVLGHTHCGAVDAAIHHDPDGHIKFITDAIRRAIRDETDDYKACCLNVDQSVRIIEGSLGITPDSGLKIKGAVYHIDSGAVEFL